MAGLSQQESPPAGPGQTQTPTDSLLTSQRRFDAMIRMLRAALYSRSAQTDARSQSAGRCSADEQTLHSEPDQRLKIGYVPGFADENAYVQRTQDALAH